MNKPVRIFQFNADAIRQKLKFSNRTGKRYDVRWYNVGAGWGKKKGWGIFEKEDAN